MSAFFSILVRHSIRVSSSVKSVVHKSFSAIGNMAAEATVNMKSLKALRVNNPVVPKQTVDSTSHKVLTISNVGHVHPFVKILFAISTEFSNSTGIKSKAKAISALVTNLEARRIRLLDNLAILLLKDESVKNNIAFTNIATVLSLKVSSCRAKLYIINSAIDITKKMSASFTARTSIQGNLHLSMLKLNSLGEFDEQILGDMDDTSLGTLDISQEY